MNQFKNVIFMLFVIVFLSGSFSISQTICQGVKQDNIMNKDDCQMFGIKLRPEATVLRGEVEKYYGKAVREELVGGWASGYWGESEVIGDGTPVIRLNSRTGKNEINIVHELWHLKLTAQGFPARKWAPMVGMSQGINQSLMHDIDSLMLDAILHSKFYPEMRKMGYDADAWDRPEIKLMIETSLLDGTHKIEGRKELLPLSYFKFYLESSDRELVSQLGQWYKQNNLSDTLEVSKKLVKIIEVSETDTPEQQVKVYIECLNVLLQGIAQFKVVAWGTENLGTFTRRTVTICILPPK
jgi:hypothetical protein